MWHSTETIPYKFYYVEHLFIDRGFKKTGVADGFDRDH